MIDFMKETKDQKLLADLLRNRDWLNKNLRELQNKYSEKWLAIADEKIVSHGEDPEGVKKEVEKLRSERGVLIIRIPKGEISKPI